MRRLGIGLFCVCVLLCACALAQLRGETPSQRVPQINPRLAPVPSMVRVAESVMDSYVVQRVKPTYPQAARRNCIHGDVVLQVLINKQGRVGRVTLISGPELLADAAMKAVQRWRYKPFLLNGQPVNVQTNATVHFKVPDECGNGRVQV